MKRNNTPKNYLSLIPIKSSQIGYNVDDKGSVTLEKENKGCFNRIAQKLFRKPKISYIHLEEMGSFIWPLIDGEADVEAIGKKVEAHFGEKADPLYPRLAKYFQILESYGFVQMKEKPFEKEEE